ncbi:MAG TPA: hypothetical protein DEO70_03850 [Bacteroidales bacterium]|nr:MAG: hypothetical protein A2X11_01165 [Bacteroidetes bacterium GWE2_42_24]OFY27308.1 MAG: hypothetical protein A2X09_00375 [Bacteroidetes bacterium GWF2_43_11]HBZ65946.1 hypothetical protein [Bacteroidales bacterium]
MIARFIKLLFVVSILLTINVVQAQTDEANAKPPKGISEAELKANADAFAAAYKFLLLENYTSAQKNFEEIVNKYKWDAASRYELARIYAGTDKIPEAVELAEGAYQLDPSNKWYGELLGSLYEQSGQTPKLIKLIEKMLRQDPNNTAALEKMASAWLNSGKPAKAIVYLNKIEALEGVSEPLSLQKHKIYAEQLKKKKEAARELIHLADAFPEEDKYLMMLAEYYGKNSDYKEAVKVYDQLLARNPDNVYTAISMADMYNKMGDREKVRETLHQAFASKELGAEPKLQVFLTLYTPEQIYTTEKEAALDLVNILNATHPNDPKLLAIRGDLLYKSKREEEARTNLLQSIAIDSSRYFVWEQLMFVMSAMNDTLGLTSFSYRCRQLFPFQPIPYFFEGLMKARAGQHAEAARIFREGKALVTDNNALLEQFAMFLGDTYHALNLPAESDSAYEETLRYNPENIYVLNNYAYYLSERGVLLGKAEKMSAKAIAAEPNNATYLDTYAWVLFKLGRYEESHFWMSKTLAAEEKPGATLYDHAGDILFKLNRVDEAVQMWQKALLINAALKEVELKINRRSLNE